MESKTYKNISKTGSKELTENYTWQLSIIERLKH